MTETVEIPTGTNVRDLAFKLFWTVALLVVVTAGQFAADQPATWWTPVVGAGLQLVLSFLRQKQGVTPPTLPAAGPVGETLPDALTGPA